MRTWETSRLRAALVWLVVFKCAGLIVIFDVWQTTAQPFDLPKALFSRGTEWLLAAGLVLSLYRYGPAILGRTRIHLAVAAVVAVTIAAAFGAENRYVALFGEGTRFLGVTFVIDMAVLYLAVAASFRRTRDWYAFGAAFALAVLVTIVWAWLQAEGFDEHPWTLDVVSRPFSTMGNPNTYGHLLSVAFGVACAIALFAPAVRGFALAFAVAIVLTAARIATRGTLLGIGAVLVTIAVLYLTTGGATRARAARVALVGVAVTAALAGVMVLSPLGPRVVDSFRGIATRDRLLIYEAGVSALRDRPLLGYGPDNFGVAWPRYRPADFTIVWGPNLTNDSAHDWVLQTAATTGLVGLAALSAAIAATSLRLWRDGLPTSPLVAGTIITASAAYWANALVSVGTAGVDWVAWVAFGAAAALPPASSPAARRVLHPALAALVIAIAIGGALTGRAALAANQQDLRARQLSDLAQGDDAVAAARAAVALDGGRADYWNELGRASFIAGNWSGAVSAFGEATARAPQSATYWSNRASARLQLATSGSRDVAEAERALADAQRGASVDPNDPRANSVLAEVGLRLDRYDVALEASLKAMRLDPTRGLYVDQAVRAAMALPDTAAARRALADSVAVRDNALLRVTLAQLALRSNDRDDARAQARRALELDPRNTEARDILRNLGG